MRYGEGIVQQINMAPLCKELRFGVRGFLFFFFFDSHSSGKTQEVTRYAEFLTGKCWAQPFVSFHTYVLTPCFLKINISIVSRVGDLRAPSSR